VAGRNPISASAVPVRKFLRSIGIGVPCTRTLSGVFEDYFSIDLMCAQ
jgi:hypothetical protein